MISNVDANVPKPRKVAAADDSGRLRKASAGDGRPIKKASGEEKALTKAAVDDIPRLL
jgi:hypothetical protein